MSLCNTQPQLNGQAVQLIPEEQVRMGVSGVSQEGGSGPQQAEGQADHWKRPAPVVPVPAAAQPVALGWKSAQALAQWVTHEIEHLGAPEGVWGWGRGRGRM